MEITIEIDDKYQSFLNELCDCAQVDSIESLFRSEIMSIIHENLEDYGYDEDGQKFYINDDGITQYEDENLNHDTHDESRLHYSTTRGV